MGNEDDKIEWSYVFVVGDSWEGGPSGRWTAAFMGISLLVTLDRIVGQAGLELYWLWRVTEPGGDFVEDRYPSASKLHVVLRSCEAAARSWAGSLGLSGDDQRG